MARQCCSAGLDTQNHHEDCGVGADQEADHEMGSLILGPPLQLESKWWKEPYRLGAVQTWSDRCIDGIASATRHFPELGPSHYTPETLPPPWSIAQCGNINS